MPHAISPEDKQLIKIFTALAPIKHYPDHTQLYLLTRLAAHLHGEIHRLMQDPSFLDVDEAQPT